jgi:hypothetical protein
MQAEEREIAAAREAVERARLEEEARKAAHAADLRRKAEEKKRQEEEAARKKAEEKQKALQLELESQKSKKAAEASASENVLKKEADYKAFIQQCKNLKNDPKLNSDRATIKQLFTLRLNQLTNKKDHIMRTVCYCERIYFVSFVVAIVICEHVQKEISLICSGKY